jgi:aminoglycoside 3-N-acetyltransferase I
MLQNLTLDIKYLIMEIKKLANNETKAFRNLIEIFNEVFENDKEIPNNDYLRDLLSKPNFIVFVAMINNKVIGGLSGYVLEMYNSTQPDFYIYDIAVLPDFQKRGIGRMLINSIIDYCNLNGFKEIFVQAEMEDSEAIAFYRKTKVSSEMNAVQFTFSLVR